MGPSGNAAQPDLFRHQPVPVPLQDLQHLAPLSRRSFKTANGADHGRDRKDLPVHGARLRIQHQRREPFLRKDLAEIIRLACRHLTPGIIHIPTNAIAADRIFEQTEQILAYLKCHSPRCTADGQAQPRPHRRKTR